MGSGQPIYDMFNNRVKWVNMPDPRVDPFDLYLFYCEVARASNLMRV
jgi:hypothetical protein